MQNRIRLTPLTAEERDFAADNYPILQACIRSMKLCEDYYDVAYLGYLHAVKKWFARPDLQQWAFGTIARQTIRTHVGNDRKKEGRRIRTVSLDDVIPGTDGLTYGNYVTYNNLSFLRGEMDVANKTLQIDYDVTIPEAARLGKTPSVEIETLVNFLDSNHKNMRLTYQDVKTAGNKAQALRCWLRKRERKDVKVYRMIETLYVEKTAQKGKLKDGRYYI